jgi:hypothetical protein
VHGDALRSSSAAAEFWVTFDRIGLPFEEIAPVPAAAMSNFPCARQSIGWQKKYTPLLVLPDVNIFMLAQCRNLLVTCAQNDMAKCHGAKAERTRKRSKETPNPAALKLKHSGHDAHSAAKSEHDKPKQYAKRCVWRSPDVCNELGYGAAICTHIQANEPPRASFIRVSGMKSRIKDRL